MLLSLSLSEMLDRRRAAAGLKLLRNDCTVTQTDGIDFDAMLAAGLRQWYLNLLDTADPTLLPTADIATSLTITSTLRGTAYAQIPSQARRILNIRLSTWRRPAIPVPEDEFLQSPRAEAILNPFSSPSPSDPLALVTPDRQITLTPFSDNSDITTAIAVIDPGPDTFILDESLIPT